MHAAVLTAGQIFINDLTNKVSWAVRLTHGSPQKCVTGGRCAGWHPHTPAVKPGMIPHYAPCLNLNLANSGHWRTKNGETGEIAEILVKKSPARGGNAVHLSGAALRFTGKRVFDIFTALGLDGLGRFSMNMTPMQP
ncbi:hypothetical protein, partial [Aeromonas caviae]|uniref:hypothetical protein n=1 Tax=Aeromonas caviae TaxID=648 RepID=UPI0038D160B3